MSEIENILKNFKSFVVYYFDKFDGLECNDTRYINWNNIQKIVAQTNDGLWIWDYKTGVKQYNKKHQIGA